MRYVAAIPASGLIAGAAVGLLLPDLPHPFLYALLIAAAAAAVCGWRRACPTLVAAAVCGVFFGGGALLASDAWQRAWRPPLRAAFEAAARDQRAQAEREGRRLPEDDQAFMVVEGVLRADAALTESGVSLNVDVDRIAGRERQEGRAGQECGGIAVTVVGSLGAGRLDEWRAGRRIRLPVQLHRPPRYLDPGVPDHERALARRGTTLVGSVKSGALVEVLSRGRPITEAIATVRGFARRAIRDAVGRWSERSSAIVAAIVIGDRVGLDEEVQRRLQEAGTYHVIAISGGNIAILAGLLLGAFRFAGWLGRAAMVTSIAALLAYAELVGGGASVDRATLMAIVAFGARIVDHRSAPLTTLLVVAALLVCADPLAVADPAFVLTCGATLAILLFVPAAMTILDAESPRSAAPTSVSARADRAGRRPSRAMTAARSFCRAGARPAVSMLAASVAAEALLFPVGALVFARVTFAGIGLNFLAIPLMGVAQVAGMAVVPLAVFSTRAAAGAGWIAHAGAAGLVASAGLVRLAPAVAFRVAPPAPIVVTVYYGALAIAWTMRRRRVTTTGSSESRTAARVRRASAVAAGLAALWILVDPHTLVAGRGDGRLHVTALDVGQGDAIFVVFPRGTTLLVDAGGVAAGSPFDIGDRVVAPVIRDGGFRRLDYVALTHGDPDHIGGADSILREFRPREVWEGIPVPRSDALTQLRMETEEAGGRWANVYAGDHAEVDGVDVVARHPYRADWERQKVRNDDSLVLELRWRDVSIVLTGDIGKAVEHDLASVLPPARLRVVKIPHHGSLTSSTPEFVKALKPQVAIVSAGRSNHFGHPVPEVLERYRSAGAEVFRTDRDGAVTVTSDGYSLDVRTFSGRQTYVR